MMVSEMDTTSTQSKAKTLVDQLLVEMPQFKLGEPDTFEDEPDIDYTTRVGWNSEEVWLKASATVKLPDGRFKRFEITKPLPDERCPRNVKMETALKQKYAAELERMERLMDDDAWSWWHDNKVEVKRMSGVETIATNLDPKEVVSAIHKEFRYIFNGNQHTFTAAGLEADSLAAFTTVKGPNDTLVKLIKTETATGNIFKRDNEPIYVLVNPEELTKLKRILVTLNRGNVFPMDESRAKATALIDQLLMEMPQLKLGSPSDSEAQPDIKTWSALIDKTRLTAPSWEMDQTIDTLLVVAAVKLPDGRRKGFRVTHPLSDEDIQRLAIPSQTYNSLKIGKDAILADYSKDIARMAKEAKQLAIDWFKANNPKVSHIPSWVERIETDLPALKLIPAIQDFRYVYWGDVGVEPGGRDLGSGRDGRDIDHKSRQDLLMSVVAQRGPNDRLVELVCRLSRAKTPGDVDSQEVESDEWLGPEFKQPSAYSIYVLATSEELAKLKRIIVKLNRESVFPTDESKAEALVDQILMEMPQYLLRDPDKSAEPAIDDKVIYHFLGRRIFITSHVRLPDGRKREFSTTIPLTDEDMALFKGNDADMDPRFKSAGSAIKDKYKDMADQVAKSIHGQAAAWVKKNFTPIVQVPRVDQVVTNITPLQSLFPALDEIGIKYAWVRANDDPGTTPELLSGLKDQQGPGEKLVKLVRIAKHQGTSSAIYALVSPSELAQLNRKIIELNREQI